MTILITTALRSRIKDTDNVAKLPFDLETGQSHNQDELQDLWKAALGENGEHLVSAVASVGGKGIFTNSIAKQAQQIVGDNWNEQTFFISYGLGLVEAQGSYPQYDLGKQENNIGALVEGQRSFHPDGWWKFLTSEVNDASITDVVIKAIADGEKVILAVNYSSHNLIRGDLKNLIDLATGDEGDFSLGEVHRTLRIVGNEEVLETSVDENLLPCLMPINPEGVNKVVPGGKMNVLRRIAFLTTQVTPSKASSAMDDYDLIEEALSGENVFEFVSGTQQSYNPNARKKLTDEEVLELIDSKYSELGRGKPIRITRLMKSDGFNVTVDRVNELMNPSAIKKKAKVKTKPKATTKAASKSKGASAAA